MTCLNPQTPGETWRGGNSTHYPFLPVSSWILPVGHRPETFRKLTECIHSCNSKRSDTAFS
jgi:hypothetical protein